MRHTAIDAESLEALGILNFKPIITSGVVIGARGESLSGAKNRKHLQAVKEAGIDVIIDLRTTDQTGSFRARCEAAGLDYCHFPIDKSHTPDDKIIKYLPELIEKVYRGGFYIACAQGLHRTDIALALLYLMSPRATEPPILYGHHRNGVFRCEDIYQRAHRIYRRLSAEDKHRLGWDEAFDRDFINRIKLLTALQIEIINE